MAIFKKSLTKSFMITLVIVLILIAGIWYVSKDINKRVASIQSLQNQIAVTLGESYSLATLRPASIKANEITPILDTYLIDKDDVVVNFKSAIEALAKENKITSLNFSFTGEGILTSEGFTRTSFNLNFISAYDDLTNFLKSARNSRFMIKFINPDISQQDARYNTSIFGQVFSF